MKQPSLTIKPQKYTKLSLQVYEFWIKVVTERMQFLSGFKITSYLLQNKMTRGFESPALIRFCCLENILRLMHFLNGQDRALSF